MFFVTAVWLPRRWDREECVTDLSQETTVPGICFSELESNMAACPASLTKFRSDVSFVNVNVHGLPLFFDKSGEADSCQLYDEAWGNRSKTEQLCQRAFVVLPHIFMCVLFLPDRCLNGISQGNYFIAILPRMVSVNVSTTIVMV
jgi:hypothetical protein